MQKSLITKTMLLGYTLLALLVLQPTSALGQKHSSSSKSHSVNISNRNGKSTISIKENGNKFKIEYEGEFTISNDDKDIIAISKGGFIDITKSSFGNKRRVLIESDRSGSLIHKYFEGRSEKEYHPDGKSWLAEILPEIIRSTTIGAESRVNRFYNNGGTNAVLREIQKMDSDYVKAAYFKLLLSYNLKANELVAILDSASKEIESDHYLSEILKENQSAFLVNSQTITAYINATKSINSDHYITSVLKAVINDSSISDNQMESLLDISKSIESDHYLTQILTELMDHRTLNTQNYTKIISLSKAIESDHYKTQVLNKVIASKGMPKDAYNAFLETLSEVESDHYATLIISELFDHKFDANSNDLNGILTVIRNNIDSDHYASTIYKKMAKNNDLTENHLIAILKATSHMESEHYLSETLIAFSYKVNRASDTVKSAYRTAAKSIDSDTYYGRAIKAIN